MSTKPVALAPPENLAQVLQCITALDLPRQKQHELSSAIRRIAKLLGALPADVPADPEALRRKLILFTAAGAGMKKRRWSNVRALLTKALALTGARVMRSRRRASLKPAWAGLLKRAPNRFERYRLARFFSYASENGVEPDDVDDQTVADFGESLKRYSLAKDQARIVRETCRIWNRCAASVDGWPVLQLTVPNRRRVYALPADAYSQSFNDELQAYLVHLANGDLFAKTGRGPASPTTLRDLRLRLFQAAAALVHSGRPPETIRSLADLVAPEAVRTTLKFLYARNGRRKTGQLHNFALTAIKIARYWVKAPPEQIEALQQIRREVDPKSPGMTARNRMRLRQFDDPENLRRLIELPEKILRALPRSGPLSHREALRVQLALAIAILLVAPIRMRNLAALHVSQHLIQTRPGGLRHIVIPAEEVKNRAPLAFEVSRALGEIINVYLARCRPVLATVSDGYLFPSPKGGAKTPKALGEQIKDLIAKETGLDLNPHAFRHLSAKLFLAAHPGEYESVRLILGHRSIATTVNAYCGLEQADALRRLDALIDQHRKKPGNRHDLAAAHR